jgi:alanyl-tRNA synthetase
MTINEIRSKYLEFFKSRGHTVIPSASLVPQNDPTTLFTGSGMQPMIPYLLGEPHPLGTRIADSQKSFREVDIDEVGDNRHTTFFEMLGNWSLGDYFKKEQIEWMFEFLTSELGIDPLNLYVTVWHQCAARQRIDLHLERAFRKRRNQRKVRRDRKRSRRISARHARRKNFCIRCIEELVEQGRNSFEDAGRGAGRTRH